MAKDYLVVQLAHFTNEETAKTGLFTFLLWRNMKIQIHTTFNPINHVMPTSSAPLYDGAGEKNFKESQAWA